MTGDDSDQVPDAPAGLEREFDDLDAALLDDYQSGFPVRETPFEAIADRIDADPDEVFERVRSYVDVGLVRRVGPVLDPSAIGSSTLAALRVPDEEVDEVAAVVNEYPEVSHNYRRDHEWNVWFVLTAQSREQRSSILDEIASRTGYEPLSLPKLRKYCLDLQFPIVRERGRDAETARERGRDAETAGVGDASDDRQVIEATAERGSRSDGSDDRELTAIERTVLDAIQDGFPPTRTPYADIAAEIDETPSTVVSTIDRLLEDGFIKRIGFVVDRRAVGYDANAMIVWAVPEAEIDEVGARAGGVPAVTKCYYRPQRPERGWEYTLFTMIHGTDPAVVDEVVEELASEHVPYPHERLETVERFKQTGTRYGTLLGEDGESDR